MRTWFSSIATAVFLFAALHVAPVQAAGATGEEDALAGLNTGRFALALSGDGSWLFHVDDHNVLHREATGTSKKRETVALPMPVQVVSSSRNGERVAVVGINQCVGIVTFATSARPAKIVWLRNPSIAVGEKDATCDKSSGTDISDGRHYEAFAAALSQDGALVALSGKPIRVVDTSTQRTLLEIPTGNAVPLHLRFADADRKLFVTQAVMGEQWESASTGSDMQFAIWDLKSRELFSFHHTGTPGNLLPYDFLSHFSEATGELWAINTNGSYWDKQSHRRASIRPYATNLKQCGTNVRQGPVISSGEEDTWLAFIADPMGRWLAYVLPTFNAKLKRYESHLWVRNSRSGNVIADWSVDAELHSLISSEDGSVLYGVTAGQPKPDEMAYTREGQSRIGGGKLVRFDLGNRLTQLEQVVSRDWPPTRCLIEGEDAEARNIVPDKEKQPKLYEVLIGAPKFERDFANMPYPCHGDAIDEFGHYQFAFGPAWAQVNDGSLWVDHGATIDHLNPETGKTVQSLPTPRSESICALPMFEQRKYIAWQGDTVSIREFTALSDRTDRKVLVRKPGWYANRVERLGADRIGVRWVDRRFRSKNSGEKEIGALAIAYDFSGKEVSRAPGAAMDGNAFFLIEDGESSESIFGAYPPLPMQKGIYRWELSYFNSVRAIRDDAASNSSRTVLWSGLRLNAKLSSKPGLGVFEPEYPGNVVGLSDTMGAHIKADKVDVYDGESRHLRASISIQGARDAAWNPVNRIFLIDSIDPQQNKGKLTAYRFLNN